MGLRRVHNLASAIVTVNVCVAVRGSEVVPGGRLQLPCVSSHGYVGSASVSGVLLVGAGTAVGVAASPVGATTVGPGATSGPRSSGGMTPVDAAALVQIAIADAGSRCAAAISSCVASSAICAALTAGESISVAI